MIKQKIVLEVPIEQQESWQDIVDIMAKILHVPTALIMRFTDPYIEVFVSSKTSGNPYHRGEKEIVAKSGYYCERVLQTKDMLLVPNALADEEWKDNPDLKLNMISYLGLPILLPDGTPFGTLCVLDNKENSYSKIFQTLLQKFRNLIQKDLEIIFLNQVLGDRNRRLTDYMEELQIMRGMKHICTYCKSIQNDNGEWHPIEDYLLKNPEADFSHSVCPQCIHKLQRDMEL